MVLASNVRAALATEINQHRHEIAAYATEKTLRAAYWELRYGERGRISCMNDNLKNLEIFSLAIRNGSPMIADNHVLWLRDLHIKLGMCTIFVVQAFTHMQAAAANHLSPEAARALADVLERSKRVLVYTDPLCQEITRHQDAVVEVVVNAMYSSNPYWEARYGERGRASCAIDTYYNIAYLVDALGSDNTKGILIHTAWMRNFLISRGMCSDYYTTAWSLLIDGIIAVVSVQYHDKIRALHRMIMDNLKHDHPYARLIEGQRDAVIEKAVAAHYDRTPALKSRFTRYEYGSDVRHKLSYFVDAVALNQPDVMTNYLDWVRGILPQLNLTRAEFEDSLSALAAALPPETPAQAKTWLVQRSGENAQAAELKRESSAVASAVWNTLHAPNTYWAGVMGRSDWQSVVETAVAYGADALQTGDFRPGMKWLLKHAQEKTASRAYLLDYMVALRLSARKLLSNETVAQLDALVDDGLIKLAEEDAALALLLMPRLVEPIILTLQQYSPYWQVNNSRRSAADIERDVRVLIGALADELMELNKDGFLTAVEGQRRYLLSQGICTAFFQQVIDFTVEILKPLLDYETSERAVMLLEAANASLETENPYALEMAAHQDDVVTFVIDYLKQTYPDWVNNYPGGWEDATTDMYYWLGYVTDAITFNNPEILAGHVGWLFDYARNQGNSGDHIRVSLIALGHAFKTHLPESARTLLAIMQPSLARLPQGAR